MSTDSDKPRPERQQTDESLRIEREKTDRALLERQAALEKDADLVVLRARETADAVLVEAREKADELVDQNQPGSAACSVLPEERIAEDNALRQERAAADASLRRERDENARVLARVLPLERDKTDRFLLTERERSDDDLEGRDDFLGIVSHDLRNLIGGVVLSAEILTKSSPEGEAGMRILQETARLRRYAARMNRLVGDLVDVASMDAGKLAISRVRGDAVMLLAEAVDLFQPAASTKEISLRAETLERPLTAEFDHDRILQVLANLVTNAIKFTPPGGSIEIRGERVGKELRFAVTDTGSGIPAGMQTSVFERFWQVSQNDKRGLGLGLYISMCIVEAHGGSIWVESTVGEGSTFYFTLPAAGASGD